jgi:hypothetical protein
MWNTRFVVLLGGVCTLWASAAGGDPPSAISDRQQSIADPESVVAQQVPGTDDRHAGTVPDEAAPGGAVPGGMEPLLRLAADGPLSQISALAFSPDGETLYAAGWDKVVHVWVHRNGAFHYDRDAAYRIPIGGGLDGGINAIAVSDDGRWLAVGGRGAKRGVAGQRDTGFLLPGASLSEEAWMDEGQIHVFEIATRRARTLRGHQGSVVALQFASGTAEQPPVLVSLGATRHEGQDSAELIAWQVGQPRQIARTNRYPVLVRNRVTSAPLPAIDPGHLPQMAVRRNGTDADDLHVSLTWGPTAFGLRTWDVKQNQITRPVDDDPIQYFTLFSDRAESFLTAGGNTQTGRVEVGRWNHRSRRDLSKSRDYQVLHTFSARDFPTRMASLEAVENRLALVVTQMEQQSARLVVLEGNGRRVVAEQPLWDGAYVANLAAGGEHLAVSHAGSNEVLLYRQRDLVRPNARPQRLHLDRPRFESARFVRQGDRAGLLLRRQETAPLVFGLTERGVTTDVSDWENDSISTDGWEVETISSAPGECVLSIKRDGMSERQIRVASRVSRTAVPLLTAAALFPGNERLKTPLLIGAFQTNLQPELHVYTLNNGEQVRQLTAHTGVIRHLSITADGRLLASVANDGVLCVWQLSDVPDRLGRHGLIRQGNRMLEVESSSSRTAPQGRPGIVVRNGIGKLEAGTEIHSVIINERERVFADARDLYEFVHLHRPGETIRFNTSGGIIDVPVGEAIDDRKPLFSLFLYPDERQTDWEWIAWNPQGPYAASSRAAERHLGWHFNTSDPSSPARFAAAEEYRETYLTPRLLPHLYRHERLPPRQPAEAPTMTILIRDRTGAVVESDFSGQVPLQTTDADAVLQITGAFPPRLIERTECLVRRVGESSDESRPSQERPVELVSVGESEWQVPLSPFAWKRGTHRVTMRIITRESPPRSFEETLDVRFQPPAPVLHVDPLPESPESADVQLQVRMTTATIGDDTEVPARLILRHSVIRDREPDGRDAPPPLKTNTLFLTPEDQPVSGTKSFAQPLTLEPGLNRIEVIAANVPSLYGFESLETTASRMEVTFDPPPESKPPRIGLRFIGPAEDPEDRQPDDASQAPTTSVEVDRSVVLVSGVIDSERPLRSVRIRRDDHEQALPALEGTSGKQEFQATLTLDPGRQQIQVIAETEAGDRGLTEADVFYRPRLPLLTNVRAESMERSPDNAGKERSESAVELVLIDELHLPRIQLSAEMEFVEPEGDGPEYEITVLIDGEVQGDLPVQIEQQRVSATVPIHPGRHHVRFRISNAWQRTTDSPPVTVEYRRPPRIVGPLALPDVVMEPSIDRLELMAEAPRDRPPLPNRIRLLVNDAFVPVPVTIHPLQEGQWRIVIRDVPLGREGDNRIRLEVGNADGQNLSPVTGTVRLMTPPPPLPEVTVLEPGSQSRLREVTLRFSVKSESPLRRVTVEHRTGSLVAGSAPVGSEFVLLGDFSASVSDDEDQNGRSEDSPQADEESGTDGVETVRLRPRQEGPASEGDVTSWSLPVRLLRGVNEFRITAVNDGGPAESVRMVSFTPPPARVRIERLGTLQPVMQNEQVRFISPVPAAYAELTGVIEWNMEEPAPRGVRKEIPLQPADDSGTGVPRQPPVAAPEYAQFWVNGFMQQSVKLEPVEHADAAAGEPGAHGAGVPRQFRVQLTFNREHDNVVEVNLPGHAVDAASRKQMTFQVNCDAPQTQQDLYLLIIGAVPPSQAPENYREMLEQRARRALTARLGADRKWSSPAFSEIHTTVLTGRDAVYTRIQAALGSLRFRIRPPIPGRGAAGAHPVLMVYYHGREARMERDGRTTFVLATTDTWNDPATRFEKSLKDADLLPMLRRFHGAHVLFLDVESVPSVGDRTEPSLAHGRWPDDPWLGIVRTAWNVEGWPSDAPPLISTMESVMPGNRLLGEVVDGIERSLMTNFSLIQPDFKIPATLTRLEVGGLHVE